jgi:hypothetical protein
LSGIIPCGIFRVNLVQVVDASTYSLWRKRGRWLAHKGTLTYIPA